MLDPRLVERLAEDLGTSPGLVEKDWHVVRALGVIAQVDTSGMMPAFSGGTSLSKGWELIKRFSEDIDFKVGEPAAGSALRWRGIGVSGCHWDRRRPRTPSPENWRKPAAK